MNNLAIIIGNRIRSYRKIKGLSQEKLSELASCHPTYIGQLERGEKNATIESIEKIAEALNISLSQLFDKLEVDDKNEKNYPLLCYELILDKNIKEQQYLFNLLTEIDTYKNL